MRNGQLKPGYNLQATTSDQFILHYSLHQTTADTTTLIPHLKGFEKSYQVLPDELTADAGYGSEENYLFLEENNVEAYVKYNTFDITKKSKKRIKKYPFASERLHYNAERDILYCPMGQPMHFIGNAKNKTTTGFVQDLREYQAQRCQGCPIRGRCHKSKNNRIVQLNFRKIRLRQQSKLRLESEQGIKNRKQRPVDVEPVFGHLKYNRGFRRFLLRGLEKVQVEVGLLALAHNLKKLSG